MALLLFVLVFMRSGSSHTILSFLWRKVMGGAPIGSSRVQARADQRDAWIYFRALSGLAARTLPQSERMILWADRHDEEVDDVARCGSYFDLERMRLKVPKPWEKLFCAIVLSLGIASSLGFFVGAQLQWAWVEVKQAHAHYLALDTQQVEVLHSGNSFRAADCRNQTTVKLAEKVGLEVTEAKTVCGWFNDPEFFSKVETTLAEQRTAFLIFDLMALCWTWSSYRLYSQTMAARAMGKRLAGRPKGRRSRRTPVLRKARSGRARTATDPG